MDKKRAKIVIQYEIDLDPVPGFGNKPQDWAKFLVDKSPFMVNTHYNPSATVVSVDTVEATTNSNA